MRARAQWAMGFAVFVVAGGLAEAALVLLTINDAGPLLNDGAFGFLAIPVLAIALGLYVLRPGGRHSASLLFVALWYLLPTNFAGFIFYLVAQGLGAP